MTPLDMDRIERGGQMLSFSQERLWFLQQLDPASAAHNIVARLRIPVVASLDVVERCVEALARRHETLRTYFTQIAGRPVATVSPVAALPLRVVDLGLLCEPELEAALDQLALEEAAKPFDLEHGPVARVTAAQTDAGTWWLLIGYHHIAADRWSAQTLARELATLCESAGAASLPEPARYSAFADAQRAAVHSDQVATSLAYWRDQLGHEPPILNLSTDRSRSPHQSYQAGSIERPLRSAVVERVRATASDQDSALTVMMSAFVALLGRYTGQDDLVVGLPVSARESSVCETLVGSVGNTLLVRADLSDGPSFSALRQRVAASIATAERHADLPFDLLVSELRPRRDMSRNPVCQVALSLESGCAATAPARVSGGTLFDLTLFVVDDRGFTVRAEYNQELFDAETIIRMLDHFETLLEAALADTNAPVSALQLLTDIERSEIVNGWNETAQDFGSAVLLTAIVEEQAEATPDAIAIQSNGHSLTYATLNARANQLAHYLRTLGVGPETLVGVCLDRTADMLAALLAILKAGGAYVPLDPTFPSDRLSFMVKDAGLTFVLTTEGLAGLIDGHVARIVKIDDPSWPCSTQPQTNLTRLAGGEHLAYVIYTSGSTGTPKGVQVRHKALVNLLLSMRDRVQITSSDRLLAVTTLSFDIAGLELYMPLVAGARVVMTTRDAATDGQLLARVLTDSAATMMQATPATWRLLIGTGWQPPPGFRILCGGEALPPDLAAELAVRGETWNLYGPTETTIWASVDRVHSGDAITIGRPLANTRMYVLDGSLSPVPVGVVGQLYIGGEPLARGYMGRVDLTAARFVPDPFSDEPGSRLYATGDLVRFQRDARIEWIGRVDHQVKVRGYRIELKEIETTLMANAAVRDAVVCIDGGADDRRLVAYIVFHPGDSLTASELRRHVKQTLPAYMVPSFFVKLDRVPLTPSGKVDRRTLPDPFAHAAREAQTAPQTLTERWLAEIWQETLNGAPVGAHDNFFDVGGHSLLSMRVIAEIEARTGHRLDPRAMVFENLDQIAARLDRAGVSLPVDANAPGAVVRT